MATKPPSKDSKPDAKAPSKADPKAQAKGGEDTEGEEAAPPKKRSKLIIGLAALLLLGGGGGAAWYLLKPAPGETEAAAKPAPVKPPVFLPLEAFTVNLMHDDASPQYLQVGLSLKMTDPAMVEAVKQRMPEVRNRILLLLSSKKASDISSPQGKEALSTELMREIGKPLSAAAPAAGGATLASSAGIESVLFTSFVIQ